MSINKAALDQAAAARKKYRSDTPQSLYSIEGEDAVFIAAYLEAIQAAEQPVEMSDEDVDDSLDAKPCEIPLDTLIDWYNSPNAVTANRFQYFYALCRHLKWLEFQRAHTPERVPKREAGEVERQTPFEPCATNVMASAIQLRLDPKDEIGMGLGRPHRFYEAAERAYRALCDCGYEIRRRGRDD